MDSFNHPNTNVYNQRSLSHNSHRIIKIFVSVSLFSVSFLLLPFLVQSFKPCFMLLFNQTIGKSYMFLLCNGLLAVLAKNSGLISGPSPSTDQTKELTIDNPETDHSEFKELEVTKCFNRGENDGEIEYRQEEEKSLVMVGQEDDGFSDTKEEAAGEGGGYAIMIIEEDEHDEEDTWVIVGPEDAFSDTKEEAAGEEGNAVMIIEEEDTEELNKKCDDFIRKMKAAFCSEPVADYCSDIDSQTALVAIK